MNNEQLVELGDLDELVRHVDRLVDAADWDGLVDLRDRCRRALERGKQLWPAASLAEYRLALDAPGKWAASVLVPDAGRFALGPLSEVAASTHEWSELAPHLPDSPVASIFGYERIVRGEDLTGDDRFDASAFDNVTRVLQEWEPRYPVAEYKADGADFGSPPPVDRWERFEAAPAPAIDDAEAIRALLDLARTWTTQSNGRAEAVAVSGDAPGAIAALGARRGRIAEVDAADGLAAMAWTAANGGAHGRRRGMAAGRSAACWAVADLGDLADDACDEVGAFALRARWYRWDTGEPETGWSLRLAVEDTERGRAWAVSAVDAAL